MVLAPFAAYASKFLTALSLLACITVACFVYLTVKESRGLPMESAGVAPSLYKRILLAILINNACRIVIIWVFAFFILDSTNGESDSCKSTDQSNLCMARYMVVYLLKIAQRKFADQFSHSLLTLSNFSFCAYRLACRCFCSGNLQCLNEVPHVSSLLFSDMWY